jgi:hypothetical protein
MEFGSFDGHGEVFFVDFGTSETDGDKKFYDFVAAEYGGKLYDWTFTKTNDNHYGMYYTGTKDPVGSFKKI